MSIKSKKSKKSKKKRNRFSKKIGVGRLPSKSPSSIELDDLNHKIIIAKENTKNAILFLILCLTISAECAFISRKFYYSQDQPILKTALIIDTLKVFVAAILFYLWWDYRKSHKIGDVYHTQDSFIRMILISALIFGIGTFELLYLYSFPDTVSAFVGSSLPQISKKFNTAITVFATLATSGASGVVYGLISGAIINLLCSHIYDKYKNRKSSDRANSAT